MAIDSDSWLKHACEANFPALEAGGVTLYPESHEVFILGRNVQCSQTHLRYLAALLSDFCKTVTYEEMMATGGRPLTRGQLNLLKVQVCHLRALLREHGAQLEIRNVYGRGYQARPSRRFAET